MDKALYVYEKIAKKHRKQKHKGSSYEQMLKRMAIGGAISSTLGSAIGPFGALAGNYVGSGIDNIKSREKHPVVSTFLGPAGLAGAIDRNTESFGSTVGAGATYGATLGVLYPILMKLFNKKIPSIRLSGKTVEFAPSPLVTGSIGGIGGAAGTSIQYGLGKLFKSKNKD